MPRISTSLIAIACFGIALIEGPQRVRSQPVSVEPTSAADAGASERLDQALDLMSGAQFVRGIAALADVMTLQRDPLEQSHIRYLAARAEQEAGRCREAIVRYQAIEATAQPDDPWISRARFGRAECLMETGESQAALELFATEAENLLTPERLQELAETLTGYAREAAGTTQPGALANPGLARGLYGLIMGLGTTGEIADEAEHFVAAGIPAGTGGNVELLQQRIGRNPSGPWACADRLALALTNADLPLHWYVIQNCDAEQAIPSALALNQMGLGHMAIEALDAVLTRFPDHERAREVRSTLGLSLIDSDDPQRAREQILIALDRPEGPDLDLALTAADRFAMRGEGDIARELWGLVKENTTRPVDFETVRYRWVELRLQEVTRAQGGGDLAGALDLLTRLGEEFPTELARTHTLKGQLLAQAGRWDEAQQELRAARTPEATQLLISMLESQSRLEEALPLRREVGLQNRTERLEVAVERPFTHNEEPALYLVTDALSSVEVRLRQINVQDHLRSMGSLEGLQDLDIDLIAPQEVRRIELSAPILDGQQQPGPTSGSVPLDDMSPGVYAVQVVGQTRQATAIVTISDIALVARSVGGDLVTLVVDRATMRPVRGAEILVTDGTQIQAEGTTDASGLYRAEVPTTGLEVLAIRGQDAAWATIPWVGGETAILTRELQQDQRQVRIYLDREMALPSERLSYVVMVSEGESPRRLPDGSLIVSLSASGETIERWELSMIGGLAQGTLTLPDTMPPGRYELAVEGVQQPFTVGQQGSHRMLVRAVQQGPAEMPGPARFLVECTGPDDLPAAGVTIYGDLRDGLDERALGRTDAAGRLLVTLPLVDGIEPQPIEIGTMLYPVVMANQPGEIALSLPPVSADSPVEAQLTWSGGENAGGWFKITRQVAETSRIQAPLIAPDWWPSLSPETGERIENLGSFQLASGQTTLTLPALPSGPHHLEIELLRGDGQYASVSRDVLVMPAVGAANIEVTDAPADPFEVLPLEYGQTVRVVPRSPSRLPMLLTVEATGLHIASAVTAGEELSLSLPQDLVGDGRLTLTRVVESGTDGEGIPVSIERPLRVERRIELVATLSEGPDRTLEVTASDRNGQPVEELVFVSLVPSDVEQEPLERSLFTLLAPYIPGQAGWSQLEEALFESEAVDAEILDMQAEQAFREMPADVIAFDQWAQTGLTQPTTASGGLGGIGFSAGGYGGGGRGSSGPHLRRGAAQTSDQDLDPRHHPVLWTIARTDATGHLRLAVPRHLIDRGYYELTVACLEGLGRPAADRPDTLGHAGLELTRSLWFDEPLLAPPRPVEPVWSASREVRRVLEPAESIRLATAGDSWAVVEVAEATPAGLIGLLLSPDLAPNAEATYWWEQFESLVFMRIHGAAASGESTPPAFPEITEWIAGRRMAMARGLRPLSSQEVSEILTEIERLPEGEIARRAEALLGLGRRSPGHSQGLAAMMRLMRAPGAREPNVVGTVALAMLLLDPEHPASARELLDDLNAAVEGGSFLGKARALEALARLGEELPVDPRRIIEELPERVEERSGQDAALALGSIARTLLLAGYRGSERPPVATLTTSGGDRLELPPGRTVLALDPSDTELNLEMGGASSAVRVSLVSGAASQAGSFLVRRTAERHGSWFQGAEFLPPHIGSVEPAEQGVTGRQMRVRLQLTMPWNEEAREVAIEEVLPPGAHFVSRSIEGAQLIRSAGGRLWMKAMVRSNLMVSYVVQLTQPTSASSEYPLATVSPVWQPAVVRGIDGETLAVGETGSLVVVDGTGELTSRLAGEVIWPDEATELSVREALPLGTAIARSDSATADQRQLGFDLLLPLLEGGRLPAADVSAAGEAAFRLALALGDDAAIRNVFSILESRAPQAAVTQDELLQVARVFRRQGEVEYALRAYRALLNLRFLAEVGAGDGLVNLGEPARGLKLVHDLTRAYPDIPSVVDSVFNVPQVLLNLAVNLPDTAEGRFQARRFRRTASRWLAEYLARYGTEERAGEAALIQLNTLAELEEWPRLVALADAFMERYGQSEFADSFLYMKAYGEQRMGRLDEAIEGYGRVAEELFGGSPSTDRDRARLAIAHIYQARGELDRAIQLYEEISGVFPDAETALATLQLEELRVPAVVEAAPGERLRIPVRVRDVESARIWVYEVDLERLFLREKQVRAVDDISLAGIETVQEREIDLPTSHGALTEYNLDLDLPGAGAYLVLLRGPTVRASTLAIVTDLQLDIVEDTGSGTLNVWVTDRQGAPQQDARVRVARPYATATDTEETDLRGLARLPGYDRQAHVLARVGDSYAVYRGIDADTYALPSQIYTTSGSTGRYDFDDSLLEGQMRRASQIQMDNAADYEQDVLGNRRQESNFELW